MNFRKNFLFVLAAASQMAFAMDVADESFTAPLAVAPSNGTVVSSPVEKELTPRQKAFVHFSTIFGALGTGFTIGSLAVSWLPEKAPSYVKTAIFWPITIYVIARGCSEGQEKMMMDFHKKHRWLLLGL